MPSNSHTNTVISDHFAYPSRGRRIYIATHQPLCRPHSCSTLLSLSVTPPFEELELIVLIVDVLEYTRKTTARWKTRGRGPGVRGPGVWKTRGLVENAGCGKRGVWWKTRGLSGKHGGNRIFLTKMRSIILLFQTAMKINSASRRETRFLIRIQIKQVILHMTCFLHRAAKYADLQICKDKIFGNLNQIFYLQVSWLSRGCRKNIIV